MIARWWEWLNASPARRDPAVAAAWLSLGLALLAAGAVRLWGDLALAEAGRGAFALLLAAIVAADVLRSLRPFLALTLGLAIAAVDLALGGSLGVILVLTDLVYAAVRYGSGRGVRIALRVGLGGAALTAIALIVIRPEDPAVPIAAAQWSLILVVSGTWGWNVRSAQATTRVAMQAQHARVTEELRRRIAHDLHDLVANQIAVAGLHIEAAKLQASRAHEDPVPLAHSLDRAKHGTDLAHGELRTLIEVLTAVDPLEHPTGTGEGLADLARLLPAGRELRWGTGGEARLHDLLARYAESTRHVLLRALRELVANAAKHGRGAVTVDVAASRITLTNDPAPVADAPAASGLGIGGARLLLRGIGADLTAGPAHPAGPSDDPGPGRVWRATITLPVSTSESVHAAAQEPAQATGDRGSGA